MSVVERIKKKKKKRLKTQRKKSLEKARVVWVTLSLVVGSVYT